ncbi:MAG: hypothetical protein KGL39_09465 [Patescibacteria group bacterium]|nr:hypothetical protein [Patescibacteria group bacterium]
MFALKPGATALTKRIAFGYTVAAPKMLIAAVENHNAGALNAIIDTIYPVAETHTLAIVARCAEIKRNADLLDPFRAAVAADNIRVMRMLRPLVSDDDIQSEMDTAAEAGSIKALGLILRWRMDDYGDLAGIDGEACREAALNGHFHIIKYLDRKRILDPIAVYQGIFEYDNLTAQKAAERGILLNVRKIFQFMLNKYGVRPAARHVYSFGDPEITRMYHVMLH